MKGYLRGKLSRGPFSPVIVEHMPKGEPRRPRDPRTREDVPAGEQPPQASSTKGAAEKLRLFPASLPSGPIFKLGSRSALSNSLVQNWLLKFTSCSLAESVCLSSPAPFLELW